MNFYYFEVTDTFGSEANYCWSRRYKVKASSLTRAIRKVNKEEGFSRLRKSYEGRWDVANANICIFGEEWDEESHKYRRTKEL